MATSYREYLPNQGQLLPSDMREWLCEGHLALHVSDLVRRNWTCHRSTRATRRRMAAGTGRTIRG